MGSRREKQPSIFVDGSIFSCTPEASERLGVHPDTIRGRCRATSKKFRGWQMLPLHNDPECDAVEECWAVLQWSKENPWHENVPTWVRAAGLVCANATPPLTEVTLTEEQIEAGNMAAMARSSKWKPTPPEAVALARQLFAERGRFREEVECKEVAAFLGWSYCSIKCRLLCGELGLPSRNVERALAFAAGDQTYKHEDGRVLRVSDDHDYHSERERNLEGWWWNGHSTFDGLTQDFVDALWVARCPCCHVDFRSGSAMTSPSLDHLVPGVRSKENARLLCRACNTIKSHALPWHLHRVADWMTKTPAEMLAYRATIWMRGARQSG